MLRFTLLLCLAVSPSLALAESPWIGQTVYIKNGKKGKVGNQTVDPGGSPTKVTQANGDWLWVGKAWVAKQDVMTIDQALVYYTKELKRNPDKTVWFMRGSASYEKGEYDNAIKDFTEAIRVDPNYSFAYNNRGVAWRKKHDMNKANSDYNEAIRLDPTNAEAYQNRGYISKFNGEYDKALKDYAESIRLNPTLSSVYNDRAWLQATCPDAPYRNGAQAVKDATKACELTNWQDYNKMDTLAAAYAEAGDFKNAVKWQKRAIELDSSDDSGFKERLKLYESGKPFREPAVKK